MSIKVLYFASLKDRVGRSEDVLTFSSPMTARAIWQQLNPDVPLPAALLAAVNMDYVDLDSEVEDGVELAFFPPVTGG